MKKKSGICLVFISILFCMTNPAVLPAQEIIFTQTENNLGITTTIGQFGCAWGDYNNDGYMDLLVSGRGVPHILYRNDNGLIFTDVSTEAGFVDNATAQGAVWGDFDNDGDLDLFTGQGGVHLYRNDEGVFTDISVAAGISTFAAGYTIWGVSAADFDQDGDLDVAFAGGNQLTSGLAGPAYVLQNDEMVFSNVATDVLGFEIILESWNPQWVDVNNDGLIDLWLPTIRTKTSEPCALFINEGGSFAYTDTTISGLGAKSAISSCWGDYDNDGDVDVFITPFAGDTAGNSRIYRNEGDYFINVTTGTVLDSAYSNSRGACFGDYDNDGDQDLLVGRLNGQTEKLFRNDGTTWTDVSVPTGVGAISGTYRGAMFIDYDNDGFLDIYFNESTKKLLHNEGGNGNHWIGIRPRGVTSNRAAIGARITVVAGDLRQIRDIQGDGGGMSQCYLWANFGLGPATTVDSLIVRWPNNTTEVALNVAADEYYIFEEGTGIISSVRDNPVGVVHYELFQNYPNPFNPTTTIEFSLAAGSEIKLQLVNILGEVVKVLASGNYPAGHHQVKLDAADLAAGIYFYKLHTDKFVQVKKLVLLK